MWWRVNEAIRMQLSAFVDGELPDNEAELLLRRLSQDAELRQHVAEYMAIGRAIRGDTQVAGVDGLRDRIAATIDEAPPHDDAVNEVPAGERMIRPLVGFAIAATVAVVAIFGLQRMLVIDGQAPQTANNQESSSYTEPPGDTLEDVLLREFRRKHAESAWQQRISTRLTSLEFSEDFIEIESEDKEVEAATE